jgi:hypothetical protein
MLAAVLLLVTAVLYYEWRVVTATPPAPVVEADTMCVAAKLGFSCR